MTNDRRLVVGCSCSVGRTSSCLMRSSSCLTVLLGEPPGLIDPSNDGTCSCNQSNNVTMATTIIQTMSAFNDNLHLQLRHLLLCLQQPLLELVAFIPLHRQKSQLSMLSNQVTHTMISSCAFSFSISSRNRSAACCALISSSSSLTV